MAKMNVKLPALLGILSADEPPRYVPVSRIRAAMKTAKIEEQEVTVRRPGFGGDDRAFVSPRGG